MDINRSKTGNYLRSSLLYIVLAILAAFTLVIFFWVGMVSLKTNQELFTNAWALPKSLQFSNYLRVWTKFRMGQYAFNTILITSTSLLFIIALAAPASYVLARKTFKGREFLTIFLIMGIGLPYQLMILPLVPMMARLGLMNTRAGLILLYTVFHLPFTVFLLIGFFRTLPSELEEAARLDGCSEFGIFRRIMFPLAVPGIITATIFNLLFVWNDYFIAMIMISDESLRPMSLGLYHIRGAMTYTQDWVSLFAATNILMVPTIIIFLFLSERVISGMTMGAVK